MDRIACAWLIRNFIYSDVTVKFATDKEYRPRTGDLRFDMFEGEFTHQATSALLKSSRRVFPADQALMEIGIIIQTWNSRT